MAEVDLKSVASNGVDPITGSPLSKEVRQAILNSTKISSSSFKGDTTFISQYVENNNQNLQLAQTNQQSLIALDTQVKNLNQQVVTLNSGLEKIAVLIQQDGASDQSRLISEAERQRRYAEQEIRIGKENEIEQKIQSAVLIPVKKLTPKVQDIFGNVTKALTFLFAGWLTNELVKFFDAKQQGDRSKLTEIKNNIIKHLGIAAGIFFTIKGGFNLVIKTLGSVVAKITGLIGKIITAPIKAVTSTAKSIFSGGAAAKGATAAATKGATAAATKGATEGATSGLLKNTGNVLKGVARGAVNVVLGATEFIERKNEGQTNVQAGAGTAASLYGAEKGAQMGANLPGPLKLPGMIAGGAAGFILAGKGTDLLTGANAPKPTEKSSEATQPKINSQKPTPSPAVAPTVTATQPKINQQKPTPPAAPAATPTVTATQPKINTPAATPPTSKQPEINSTPQTPMTAGVGNYTFNIDTSNPEFKRIEDSFDKQQSEQKLEVESTKNEQNVPEVTPPTQSNEKKLNIQPAQVQNIPKPVPNVGNLPEAKPNVIVTSSGQSPQKSQQVFPSTNESMTDVPLINSANPDNFYTLYSQLNYNVVI